MIASVFEIASTLRRMGIDCLCAAIVVLLAASANFDGAMAAPVQVLTHPVPLPPASERFREGVAAYDKGDFTKAFKIWLPLAQQVDLAAMRNVALMLRTGQGVERDPTRALWFYEEAGSKGFALAQVNAAFMLLEGDGVPKNLEAAAFWFHEAARAGSPIAQYNLAVMYERGTGVDKDMAKALGWYALAARSGSELAIKRLETLVPALEGPKAPEHAPMSPKDAGTPVALSAQSPEQVAPVAPVNTAKPPSDTLAPSFRKADTETPERN